MKEQGPSEGVSKPKAKIENVEGRRIQPVTKGLKEEEAKNKEHFDKVHGKGASIAASLYQPELEKTAPSGKVEKASDLSSIDPKHHQDLKKLATEIVSKSELFKDEDITKTSITVNLPGSVFHKAQIVLTAYKYRPLEINLSFKNLGDKAEKLLMKNPSGVKGALSSKGVRVHKLDIDRGIAD